MSRASLDETSVEAIGLSKVYWDGRRRLEIFRAISFAVRPGEGVAILGPSGSGKTTLLHLLSGLDQPTEGEVKLGGVSLRKLNGRDKSVLLNKKIGFVFQFYHLLSELTALENVMLPARIGGGIPLSETRERARCLLGRVGLDERAGHFPSQLSGGEQQRVAIARALINDPEILFCDEPTGNLDLATAAGIAELLQSFFKNDRKTVVIVTHDESMAARMNRVWNLVKRDWEN